MAEAAKSEPYDPLEEVRVLTDAGMPEGQAKAVARWHSRVHAQYVEKGEDVIVQHSEVSDIDRKFDELQEWMEKALDNFGERICLMIKESLRESEIKLEHGIRRVVIVIWVAASLTIASLGIAAAVLSTQS